MTIKQSEAERMLTFAAFICMRNDGAMRELSIKEALKKAEAFARNEMTVFCEMEGIEGVDED